MCQRTAPFLLPLLFATMAMFPAWAQSANDRYTTCTQHASENPQATLPEARSWFEESRSVAAQHCMALSLFAMGDYKSAATTLDDILQTMKPEQGKLWISMKAQAAKAHKLAGSKSQAIMHLSEAIKLASDQGLDSEMVPLLLERSKIYESDGKALDAVQDLDHAVAIAPESATYLERAEILMRMGKNESAMDDVQTVKKLSPDDVKAAALEAQITRSMTKKP